MFWDDIFSLLKGFKPIRMSATNACQAKLLAGLLGGMYCLQHENFRLSLCWKSGPLTTASAWVPTHTLGREHYKRLETSEFSAK